MYDIELIKQQFKEVITFSQNIENPKIDELFEIWYSNKKYWIEHFGNELIYEVPTKITFTLDEQAKDIKLDTMLDTIYNVFGQDSLVHFIENNKSSFYKNILEKEYNNGDIHIPAGIKMIKAFKYFIDNKNILTALQDLASMVIQENKIEGTLCFSVHPLDYLSLSQNTYNWRSCHSLDGEHKAGNLSYMLDKGTIVCYLKGDNNVILPLFPNTVPWNNKKWRTLLYVSDEKNIIFASRQYPFHSDGGIETAITLFLGMLDNLNKDAPWKIYNWSNVLNNTIRTIKLKNGKEYSLNSPHLFLNGEIKNIRELFKEPSQSSLHFNDVLWSSYYQNPSFTYYMPDFWSSSFPKMTLSIGHDVPCLCCGDQNVQSSELMICDDCDCKYGTEENSNFAYCDCCGCRKYRDDLYSVYIGKGDYELVCQHCADTECFECATCHNLIYNSDKCYDSEINEYYCPECFDNL